MLLPSDVARLVLGYLQQEGLNATSRAFILESPNLREYAEHSSEDGMIPACVFSLFGKNLTTILNEYVAAKTKETCQENQIPIMMTSLWKKLDFTLGQIKSMQNTPAFQQIQRLRTQNSLQNMRRQRALSSCQTPATGSIIVSTPGNCVASPIAASQGVLGHSTPVCYTSQQTRPSTISLSQPGESPLQIIVPDQRIISGPLSPARRKCDSPRRRGGSQFAVSRSLTVSSTLAVESQSQEAVTENLSQIVIENAREKILNDRSLQEKLAENINKILASDNSPQISKPVCSAVEPEQSIDEILGLQGEIHMTDDAIQDILEQTESDPAFQALFDLFEYGKGKTTEESEHAVESVGTQDNDDPGHVDSAAEKVTGLEHSTSGGETTTNKPTSRNVKEAKGKRKSASPNTERAVSASTQSHPVTRQTTNKAAATPTSEGTRRSQASLNTKQVRGTGGNSKRALNVKKITSSDQTVFSSPLCAEDISMDVDSPEANTQSMMLLVPQSTTVGDKNEAAATKQAESTPGGGADTVGMKTGQERETRNIAIDESRTMCELLYPKSTENTTGLNEAQNQQPTNKNLLLNAVTKEKESSCKEVQSTEPDSSKIVALKIIVSDEHEELKEKSSLNQAVSSITADHVPTIYLSSPAKTPARVLASPTASCITPEETAQAVQSLQGMEILKNPSACSLNISQPLQTRPINQETGFIQLVPTNPTFGAASGYIVVADPGSAVSQHSGVMLLSANATDGAVSSTANVVATPPRPRSMVSIASNVTRSFSPASAFIISSPVQPMLQNLAVPLSVIGQDRTGKVTVLPSQVVTLPNSTLVNQPGKGAPKLMPKDSVELGKTGPLGSGRVSNSSLIPEQFQSAAGGGSSHRRILCFDENSDQSGSNTAPSVLEQNQSNNLVLPDSQRKDEPDRLPGRSSEKEKPFNPQQQTDPVQSKLSGSEADQTVNSNIFSVKVSQGDPSDASEPQTTVNPVGSTSADSKHCEKSPSKNLRSSVPSTSENKTQERATSKPPERPVSEITQDPAHITANKENEVERSRRETRQTLSASGRSPAPTPPGASGRTMCKTSPLTKQAVEMLQDIQSQSPVSTPSRRKGASQSELPLPRTPGLGRIQEDFLDSLKTPSRQRQGRDVEGTPKHLVPPATPDLPSCSPASEAGSENSINMAAHTLMILSRAARTGAPLKDSLRQEEAGAVKSSTSKSKKRKHTETSPTSKKELQLSGSSGSKKKFKKQKKMLDSFPHDLDVDKFLSSLHYDE